MLIGGGGGAGGSGGGGGGGGGQPASWSGFPVYSGYSYPARGGGGGIRYEELMGTDVGCDLGACRL